ncbi:glycosyltransferase involved in cell wall biosynthesis [Parabacteroides sp. PF5-5]|uniref:glycosyltransferase family 2 protein n=1 Tax=unclassified Parabacteroides TaxID=2649774 RepID=UPI0024752C38|nr:MULTISPECIES: glycosyltransferase family 2 protein [unclassified Parabacteroides]MDH6306798.1 glycosyltransferase involved in cell wall biosynthesis [Parabacteroides sp. PH5-39]MDH6317684.1 glycosyltransferase involved in cell wall biosynthesis [Parabacteroides sp. PF5-13]MDH6321510.1 glycosyltransferase involved in cell wall biosynthesis [Parabacteroides sp. PH5-13]MDH6325213.1 glycosyltransferase involved in cell wall biosynthesis [Parabacteroides sp. PH5-8]MDH6328869.1 glycosyltransferas
MIKDKVVTVVLPAYNAEKTLEQTYNEIPFEIVDNVILVDDHSRDNTIEVAKQLGIEYVIRHDDNKGYGGNQKTCYNKALEIGSDIVVMLHPDYQYTPLLLHSMIYLIANDVYQVVFGSRILGKGALKGGMPLYKYIANRGLTFIQNLLMGNKLAEYHTGYRAYSAEVLKSIPYNKCSDNFVFDNEIIAQITDRGYEIAEITCPTKYFKEASSINLKNSTVYGFGVLKVSFCYFLNRIGLMKYSILKD